MNPKQLQDILDQRSVEICELKQRREELKNSVHHDKAEITRLRNEVERLAQLVDKGGVNYNELLSEKEGLEKENIESSNKINELLDEWRQTAETDAINCINEKASLKKQINECAQIIEEGDDKYEALRTINFGLANDLNSIKVTVIKLVEILHAVTT